MSVTITLPWPARGLFPNARSRMHWAEKGRATKAARELAHWHAIASQAGTIKGAAALSVHVQFVPPDRRPRDTDNLVAACKGYFDGIASACGVDDAKWTLTIERGQVAKPGCVIVTLSDAGKVAA